MKVLCDREQLREGLSVVTSVIPLKSARPAIENVYLVAQDDALELVGTDLDVAVRYRISDVKVEEPGTALVPARVTADFVRDLAGETVKLRTKGEHFVVESGDDRCELPTVDPDEFPVIARFPDSGSMPIQAAAALCMPIRKHRSTTVAGTTSSWCPARAVPRRPKSRSSRASQARVRA